MQFFQISALLFLLVGGASDERVIALQDRLNAARGEDEQIVLTLGDDFEAPAGTVLFLTRREGSERLVALARSGADEVSVLFLPRWEAWITTSQVRSRDGITSDVRYGEAAMFVESEIEFWHTHNEIGDDELPKNVAEAQRRLMWSVPSDLDLGKLYGWGELRAPATMRGVVAGVLGTMTYWSDSYEVSPGAKRYLATSLVSESNLIKRKVAFATPETLAGVAERHRGLFWYRFELFP